MQIIGVVSRARRWTSNLLVGLMSFETRMYTECTRVPTGLLECIYSVVAVAYTYRGPAARVLLSPRVPNSV